MGQAAGVQSGTAKTVGGHPNRTLQVCYFMLGMGLLAPGSCVWQCMDYLNSQYKALYPSRVISTAYNLVYMALIFVIFFGGAKFWPNRRARTVGGYCMYMLALTLPPVVDVVVNREQADGATAVQAALAAWAVGAAIAGAADALISSVVYGDAAALGPAYTHAFLAGKAACGLTMAVFRCGSKAPLSANTPRMMRLSTIIFIAAAAVLVLVCVVLCSLMLPKLQAGISKTVVPSTLSVQQTLAASYSMEMGLPPSTDTGLAHNKNGLTGMMPSMAESLLLPVWSTKLESTRRGLSLKLSRVDTSVALQGAHALGLGTSGTSQYLRQRSTVARSMGRRQSTLGYRRTTSANGRTTMDIEAGNAGVQQQHGPLAGGPLSHSSKANSCTADSTQSPGSPEAGLRADVASDPTIACSTMSRPRSHGRYLLDAHTKSSSIKNKLQHEPRQDTMQRLDVMAELGPHTNSAVDDHISPFYMASAATSLPVVSEKGESQASLHDTASHQTEDAPITPSLGESLFACWLIIRVIYPFQLAVFIPPLITAAIQPVIFNPEFSKIPPLGTWYTQVAVVAYQLGGLIGSALIPIYIPEHPKTTMLTAALTMSVFVGAFVITFKLAGGPIPIIVLAFVMYMCSGYLTSSVFCLAPSCMLADDAQMIQMMLVLTTATSLVLGGFISWAWLGIKI